MELTKVAEILHNSVELVDKHHDDQPAEVRAILVDHAIRLLSGQLTEIASPPGASRGEMPEMPREEDGPYARLAGDFGISIDQASDRFRVEDETIGLSIASGDIDRSKRKGTEEIGLLLCACNQAINGSDSYLSINVIRKEAEEMNRYDSPNFSRVFDADYFIDNRKKGSAREVRLKTHGREAARNLVQQIIGARSANAG